MRRHLLAVAALLFAAAGCSAPPTTVVQAAILGGGLTLAPGEQVVMEAPPPLGWALVALNTSARANAGELTLTRGGDAPVAHVVEALTTQPLLLLPTGSARLRASNTSAQASLWLRAFGPGLGAALRLSSDGTEVALGFYQAGEVHGAKGYVRLVIRDPSQFARIAFVQGGQATKVICVNAPTPLPKPCDSSTSTSNNTSEYIMNLTGETLYVANLSGGITSSTTLFFQTL